MSDDVVLLLTEIVADVMVVGGVCMGIAAALAAFRLMRASIDGGYRPDYDGGSGDPLGDERGL